MNAIPMSSNRHPVDQLALVRETIKNLKEHEDRLKEMVSAQMGQNDSLGGDEFIARQIMSERKGGIDEKATKAAGVDLERFRKPATPVLSIRVEHRVREDA